MDETGQRKNVCCWCFMVNCPFKLQIQRVGGNMAAAGKKDRKQIFGFREKSLFLPLDDSDDKNHICTAETRKRRFGFDILVWFWDNYPDNTPRWSELNVWGETKSLRDVFLVKLVVQRRSSCDEELTRRHTPSPPSHHLSDCSCVFCFIDSSLWLQPVL